MDGCDFHDVKQLLAWDSWQSVTKLSPMQPSPFYGQPPQINPKFGLLFMQGSIYWDALFRAMHEIRAKETGAIERSAQLCADAIAGGGVIHTFGTGHSALSAADTFFRAGGLACVNAILEQGFSVNGGCLFTAWAERQSGIAGLILDRYDLRAGEPLIVFSNSGVNCVPVEVAFEARVRGLFVIGITSRSYCEAVAAERNLERTLITECDIVIDNHSTVGDAVVPIPGSGLSVASISSITASLIYNLIVEQLAHNLSERRVSIPTFMSLNVPGAKEHNEKLINRYRPRIRNF
jgi:uncharacterized phosphosugar-binding protein